MASEPATAEAVAAAAEGSVRVGSATEAADSAGGQGSVARAVVAVAAADPKEAAPEEAEGR